ncbi:hypothetical protein Tco_0194254 [Tanacetum coccineum]
MKVCYIIYKYSFKWFLAIAAALFCSSLRCVQVRNFDIAEKDDISYYVGFVGNQSLVHGNNNRVCFQEHIFKNAKGAKNVTLNVSCAMVEPEVDFLMKERCWKVRETSSLRGRLVEEAKDGNPDVGRQETPEPIKEEEKPTKFLPPLTLKWYWKKILTSCSF